MRENRLNILVQNIYYLQIFITFVVLYVLDFYDYLVVSHITLAKLAKM